MLVLAVDVGIRACGYVLCETCGRDIRLVREGQITPPPRETMPARLGLIYDELDRLVKEFVPQAVVVETLYSHYRHPATLGVLAQVKGVVAMLAQRNKLRYCEFSTTRARKSFMGSGSADSGRVKKMAENLTARKFMSVHTADAFSLVSAFAAEVATKQLRNAAGQKV